MSKSGKSSKKSSSSYQAALFLEKHKQSSFSVESLSTNPLFNPNASLEKKSVMDFISSKLDDQIRQIIGSVFKKNHVTQHKALVMLQDVVGKMSESNLNLLMPAWVQIYKSFCFSEHIDIRSIVHEINRILFTDRKNVVQKYGHMIVVPWFLNACDFTFDESNARLSFCEYFDDPDFTFNSESFAVYHEEVISFICSKLARFTRDTFKESFMDPISHACFISVAPVILRIKVESINKLTEIIFDPAFLKNMTKSKTIKLICSVYLSILPFDLLQNDIYVKNVTKFGFMLMDDEANLQVATDFVFGIMTHRPSYALNWNFSKMYWSKIFSHMSSVENTRASLLHRWFLTLIRSKKFSVETHRFYLNALLHTFKCLKNASDADHSKIQVKSVDFLKLVAMLVPLCIKMSNSIDVDTLHFNHFDKIFEYFHRFSLNNPNFLNQTSEIFFQMVDDSYQSSKSSERSMDDFMCLIKPFQRHFESYLDEISTKQSLDLLNAWSVFLNDYFAMNEVILSLLNHQNFSTQLLEKLKQLMENGHQTEECMILYIVFMCDRLKRYSEEVASFVETLETFSPSILEASIPSLVKLLTLSTMPSSLMSALVNKLDFNSLFVLTEALIRNSADFSLVSSFCLGIWDKMVISSNEEDLNHDIDTLFTILKTNGQQFQSIIMSISHKLLDFNGVPDNLWLPAFTWLIHTFDLSEFYEADKLKFLFSNYLMINCRYQNRFDSSMSFLNVSHLLHSMEVFMCALHKSFIGAKQIATFLANLFSSELIRDYLCDFNNFTQFCENILMDHHSMMLYIQQNVLRLDFLTALSNNFPLIPTTTTDCLQISNNSDGVDNKISLICPLFFTSGPLHDQIVNFMKEKEFVEWVVTFLMLVIIEEPSRINQISSEFYGKTRYHLFSLVLEELLRRAREEWYLSSLAYYLFTYNSNYKPEHSMHILMDILSEYELGFLLQSGNISILNLVCALMASLKDPEHISVLLSYYIGNIDPSNSSEFILPLIATIDTLLGNILRSTSDNENSDDILRDILSFSSCLDLSVNSLINIINTQENDDDLVIKYFLFSLAKRSLNFFNKFQNFLLDQRITTKIIMRALIHVEKIGPDIDHINVISFLCLNQIHSLALAAMLDDYKLSLKLSDLSIYPIDIIRIDDNMSYSEAKSRTLQAMEAFINLANIIRSKSCPIFFNIFSLTKEIIKQDNMLHCDFTSLDNIFRKISCEKNLHECFYLYFDVLQNLYEIKTDEFFVKVSDDDSSISIYEIREAISTVITDSIDNAHTFHSYKKLFSQHQHHCYTTVVLNEEIFVMTRLLLIVKLFMCILFNVSPDNKNAVISSPSIRCILNKILICLFDKLPLNADNCESPSKFYNTRCIKRLNTFITNTVIEIASELPTFLHDLMLSAPKRSVQAIRQFCESHICTYVIKNQINRCLDTLGRETSLITKVSNGTFDMVTSYVHEDEQFSLVIKVPETYPFSPIKIEPLRHQANRSKQFIQDINKLQLFIMSQRGSWADGVLMWKRNLQKRLDGVEPCVICYCVLNCDDSSLPQSECAVCRKRLHRSCLLKWFASSQKKTCPFCRSNFY